MGTVGQRCDVGLHWVNKHLWTRRNCSQENLSIELKNRIVKKSVVCSRTMDNNSSSIRQKETGSHGNVDLEKMEKISWVDKIHCVSKMSLLCLTTLCLKKVPTFKLSVTLSNLNQSSKFLHCCVWNLLQNLYVTAHLTLGMLLHYLGRLNIQIFCRYSADMEENANKLRFWVHQWILVSRDISRTVLWVYGLSSWLKTKSLTVFLPCPCSPVARPLGRNVQQSVTCAVCRWFEVQFEGPG